VIYPPVGFPEEFGWFLDLPWLRYVFHGWSLAFVAWLLWWMPKDRRWFLRQEERPQLAELAVVEARGRGDKWREPEIEDPRSASGSSSTPGCRQAAQVTTTRSTTVDNQRDV
jgi:hypothetical protein